MTRKPAGRQTTGHRTGRLRGDAGKRVRARRCARFGHSLRRVLKRTGADWFPGLDRQIVGYPAGQVQGHTLERLFPGIGRLDEQLSGRGIDGPSIGESVDEGQGNLETAIRNGGPGTAIGLSEGAMVLDAVQAKLANDPTAPPPDTLKLRDVWRPACEARLR